MQIRDYIHVMDLASGHTKALDKLFTTPDIGCAVYNLGTGKGTTVLEMVAAFVKASGKVADYYLSLACAMKVCCLLQTRNHRGWY